MAMLSGIRAIGCNAPIYVAVASRTGPLVNELIRHVQRDLPDGKTIWPGPDTDSIGLEYRLPYPDRVHMTADGLDRHAELWFDVLRHSPSEPPS